MKPVRMSSWNGCWKVVADMPNNEGYHQTITLPNYCNEQEAKAVEAIIKTAHNRRVAFLAEQDAIAADYADELEEADAMARGLG